VSAADKAAAEAAEAEILYPQRTVTLSGLGDVTVHEITFVQGMEQGANIRPLVAYLATVFADNANPDYDDIAAVFEAHLDAVMRLLSITTRLTMPELADLNDTDGQLLLMTFWSVNAAFFTQRLVRMNLKSHLQTQATAPVQTVASASANSSAH